MQLLAKSSSVNNHSSTLENTHYADHAFSTNQRFKWKTYTGFKWSGWRVGTGSQVDSGWEGPYKVSGPTSCSQTGQLSGQTRLLRTSPGHGWKPPRTQTAQHIQASCATAWLSSQGQFFFNIKYEPLLFQFIFIVSHLPTLHHFTKPSSISYVTSL